ncbi:MAG TPA: iron-sulfur cluster carrier protein ApbC [Steroidobacteraceae bacterium]|nr:iron-sulfur cluster carrier protein ApbC [Steroidobacteraceae bacterium]
MAETVQQVRSALEQFPEPYLRQTLQEAGALREVRLSGREIIAEVELGFPVGGYEAQFRSALAAHLADAGLKRFELKVELRSGIAAHSVQRPLKPIPGVGNIIAVASGKGGVGKSTVAVNLALAWAVAGARVGILDADIYGPSQPLMLGLSGQRPTAPDGKHLVPLEAHGIKAMSIGFLVDPAQAVVWRGPMVTQALTQLLSDTSWGELDYLVVDMPPGTGDIQLTLAQRVPVSGAVIVTTPQDIALADARKGLAMFEKVAIPVLGIVENMSLHVCPKCGHEEHIFGAGGGARMAAEFGVQLLGELPLDSRVREEADGGAPTVVSAPDTPRAAAYVEMARHTGGALARRGRDRRGQFPQIVVEES